MLESIESDVYVLDASIGLRVETHIQRIATRIVVKEVVGYIE